MGIIAADEIVDQRKATAFHEAGHVVAGLRLGFLPKTVTVVGDGNAYEGLTQFEEEEIPEAFSKYFNAEPDRLERYRQHIQRTLAGTAAHRIFDPTHQDDRGDQQDRSLAMRGVEEVGAWENVREATLDQCMSDVSRLLAANWSSVELVAGALLEHDTLDGAAISALTARQRPTDSTPAPGSRKDTR